MDTKSTSTVYFGGPQDPFEEKKCDSDPLREHLYLFMLWKHSAGPGGSVSTPELALDQQ